jgi:hypothetical protein
MRQFATGCSVLGSGAAHGRVTVKVEPAPGSLSTVIFEELGIDRLMCFHQVGSLPHDKVMKSIRLVGEMIPELSRRHS